MGTEWPLYCSCASCAGNIANEDLDEDYGMDNGVGNANVRPNTAGAMMYNRASAAPVGAQPNAGWGYSRTGEAAPGMMKGGAGPMLVPGGGEYVDTLNSNRRPHTAHGARAGFPGPAPTAGISAGAYGVVDPSKQGLMYGEQDVSSGFCCHTCHFAIRVSVIFAPRRSLSRQKASNLSRHRCACVCRRKVIRS